MDIGICLSARWRREVDVFLCSSGKKRLCLYCGRFENFEYPLTLKRDLQIY
jgi:hypothetical protein